MNAIGILRNRTVNNVKIVENGDRLYLLELTNIAVNTMNAKPNISFMKLVPLIK
jgi:hypothetical protein